MENASKALLMAGGVLIALLIVTGLIVMWTQISDFYKSGSDTDKEEQLVKFNQQYATYDRDNVLGSDVLTLVNKVDDYNTLQPVENYVPYKEIKVTINVDKGIQKYSWSSLFKNNKKSYESGRGINSISVLLENMKDLDNNPGRGVMNKLSSNYSNLESSNNYDETMKEIIGRTVSVELTDIEKYREYSEFKNSKFNCTGREYDNDGIIRKLIFTMK